MTPKLRHLLILGVVALVAIVITFQLKALGWCWIPLPDASYCPVTRPSAEFSKSDVEKLIEAQEEYQRQLDALILKNARERLHRQGGTQ